MRADGAIEPGSIDRLRRNQVRIQACDHSLFPEAVKGPLKRLRVRDEEVVWQDSRILHVLTHRVDICRGMFTWWGWPRRSGRNHGGLLSLRGFAAAVQQEVDRAVIEVLQEVVHIGSIVPGWIFVAIEVL